MLEPQLVLMTFHVTRLVEASTKLVELGLTPVMFRQNAPLAFIPAESNVSCMNRSLKSAAFAAPPSHGETPKISCIVRKNELCV